MKHEMTERTVLARSMIFCACGWSFTVPRQNALARAAKLRAAGRRHIAEAEAKLTKTAQVLGTVGR